ncbi:hypothetical protein [Sediminibacterium sp.]|uniref:hypothetical protein n=1 Tax=Sediminibacterium sp. TaxID=1917865 RepID=UPI0025D8E88D|nr:hypothetical protein [Sediminibacterium sp.]MBW0176543.1 hypothetical protein [Sediminibacterium sp.]
MSIFRTLTTAILLNIFLCVSVSAQTSGSGDVSAIESKANLIEQNKLRIEQYKIQLLSLDSAFKARLKIMQAELAALIKERDALIDDMKKGAKCSQCGKYKSEFEKQGIDFVKHLGEVKGYAVPATTPELEATRQKYNERIALKRVQIQNYEKTDNGKIAKQKQITDLETANQTYCKDITALSKSYDTKVFAEAKAKHKMWAQELMNYVADILIAEDKASIYKARVIRFENEFRKASDSVRNAVKEKTEAEQQKKNEKVKINETNIYTLKQQQEEYIDPLEEKLTTLKSEKIKVDQQLRALNLKDSIKQVLKIQQTGLVRDIVAIEKDILTYKTNTKNKITALEKENQQLKKEVWDLTVNLSKVQEAEVAKLKPVYDRKKADANLAASKSMTDASTARSVYSSNINDYRTKQQDYYNLIDKEMYRMLTASQKVSCSIYNEIRGKVSSDWNQVIGCVQNVAASAKPYGTNVFNSYCETTFSDGSMLSGYKSFLRGLSPEDEAAVKATSNATWFELLKKQ